MAKRKMIQCASRVNRDAVRRESIDGVEHIVVTSYTLPNDIVMNGRLYPAKEVEKSYKSLERSLAPIEHPKKGGRFISANDPEAIHNFHAGAFNQNVTRDGDRIKIDKYINVQEAMKTERGRRLLDRIDELENNDNPRPIHTSTGLYCDDIPLPEPKTNQYGEYVLIAKDIVFDHDAILLDSVGAAQPSQGVGMAVNDKGQEVEVERFVVNVIRAAKSLPLADTDRTWDSGAALKRVRAHIGAKDEPNATYGRYHLWFDPDQAENFGAYKLPFVDIIDGEPHAIPAALRNAAARLGQTDGPSAADKEQIRGIIDGYLDKIRTNADGQSMSERHQAVADALERSAIQSPVWIEELYDEEVIFSTDKGLFTVPYRVDEESGRATIVGIPVPVDRVVAYTPKLNQKGDAMKELIVNALKAAGIETEGLDDDALFAKYNELQANQTGGDDSGASDQTEALAEVVANAMKPISDRLDGIEAKFNEQDDAEVTRLAGVIVNSGKYPGMDEESAKLLPVDKLKEMAANCGHSFGVSPVVVNQGKDEAYKAPSKMPE